MTASGQLRLPSCWAALPVKSSSQAVAVDGRAETSSRSPSRASSTSRAWRMPSASSTQAGARASLGVVEHLGERRPQRLVADALVELEQAPRARPAGGELGAQVGAALLGTAHLRDQLGDRGLIEHARLDHDALVGERAAVGRHRSGYRAADIGVVRAGGGEREQLADRRTPA